MKLAPFPVLGTELEANPDGSIYTNTGAIIHLKSLFCEAIDLLRIQDDAQYQRIITDLKVRASSWTNPKDIYLRKQNLVSGGKPFAFHWQALSSQMSCNLEGDGYILNEVQSKDDRQLNLVLAKRSMPESHLEALIGQPARKAANLEAYFATIRGAIITDAANLKNAVHLTLAMPTLLRKPA